MPIRRFIGDGSFNPEGDGSFNPESVIAMTTAFDATLNELELFDRSDPLAETVARMIIEIAGRGERDPERLRELAVSTIRM